MARIAAVVMMMVVFSGCAFNEPNLDDYYEKQASEQADKQQLILKLRQHYEASENFYKAGDYVKAESECLAMLELKPEEEVVLYRLGTIMFKLGRYDESAAYFERAIRVNPKNGKAQYNLASIRLMQADNHFKYYAAMVDKDTDLSKVSDLMAAIDKFNRKQVISSDSESLDKLAGALRK
ncbi:tetratricopeptide repeat protein [Ketobacter sp.]